MRSFGITRHAGSTVGIVLLLGLAAVPFLCGRYTTFITAQMLAFLYIALALELSHTFGRVLSFCIGSFFALGAYGAYYICQKLSSELAVILVGSVAVTAIAGALTAVLVVRMKGAHSAVVGTLAIGAISLLLANSLTDYTGGEDGLTLRHSITLLGWTSAIGVNMATYYLALVPASLYLLAYLWLRPTPFGVVMRAVGENDVRSEQLGFNVEIRRIVIFAASAAISGFGGAMYCVLIGHVSTALFDPMVSLNAVLWATVGGLGSPFGALIGTLVIYPSIELASGAIRYVDALVGALLIGTALLFPRGVMGLIERYTTPAASLPDDRPAALSETTILSASTGD
jgi:branched-chain amino acid transport system permease protein